jgi:hypothetical protein
MTKKEWVCGSLKLSENEGEKALMNVESRRFGHIHAWIIFNECKVFLNVVLIVSQGYRGDFLLDVVLYEVNITAVNIIHERS